MGIFSGSLASSSVHCVAMSTAALLLALSTASLFQIGAASQSFNCNIICFSDWSLHTADHCETLRYIINCYYTNLDACQSDSYARSQIGLVEQNHEIYGCPPVPTAGPTTTESATLPPPPPSPPPPPCPNLPQWDFSWFTQPNPNILTLTAPDTRPTFERQACVEYDPRELQHCSMFGFSSLRPFPSYRNGLEVCNAPGSWFLLRHRTVTVEVEGLSVGNNLNHTKLSKVNVTFYSSGSCLAKTKSYVAFANSPLSPNFTDDTAPNTDNTCGSTLQMNMDSTDAGGVVTLLAPWINTTVVIRRYADLLAVTLQVPGHLSFQSDGLCRGCPAHAHFDVVEFSTNFGSCVDVSNRALFHCWEFTQNLPEFTDVTNTTYGEICRYNLLRANSSGYGVLSFQKAVIEDAKLLRSFGNVPRRNFDIVELSGSDGAGIINNSCNPPGQSNDTTDSVDTISTTSTNDSVGGGRTTTPGRSRSTEPADSISADRGPNNVVIVSSAVYGSRRQAITNLLSIGLLSVLLGRLLFR